MTDLPDDLRDRAARAAWNAYWGFDEDFSHTGDRFRAVVDAVADVLAGHVGCEHLDGPYRRLVAERDDLRARVERAEADLAQARCVVEAAKALLRECDENDHHADDDEPMFSSRDIRSRLARPVSPDRQETELREEDLRVEHFDVPDQSVIDESGRGVRLTHTPSGVAVESATERTQLQNMAQCVELLRRELAARSVSPDPTAALSGPAGAAHTEEDT